MDAAQPSSGSGAAGHLACIGQWSGDSTGNWPAEWLSRALLGGRAMPLQRHRGVTQTRHTTTARSGSNPRPAYVWTNIVEPGLRLTPLGGWTS